MNCTEIRELLAAYVEGLLDEQEKHSVEEHLKGCASCRAELKDFADFRSRLVKNGKAIAKSNLEDDVMNRIVREQNSRLKATYKAGIALKLRRMIMKSPVTRLAAAAVIIIATVIGVSQFFGGTVTFAEVIQPILNARTVVFDFIVGDEETGAVMHDIVADSRIRRTFSNMDTIMIIDLDNAKMLTLDPVSKGAAYIDIQGPLKEQTKNLMAFVKDAVGRLKGAPAEELGQWDIGGQKAVGFLVRGHNEEVTVWADAETALPIRIEMLLGQPSSGKTRYILKNIEFDVPVDESLVSMDVPAGYALSDQKFDMSQFTEDDFITTLQIWAEYFLGGNFPENLNLEDLMNLTPQLGEKIDKLDISEQEKMQLGMTFGRGCVFFQQMGPNGVDWHYAGGGVKLGEADKAVFWYQPKGSQTYRVIYGDLSVEDVEADELPK